jgi:hypothetical protein
MLRLLDDIRTGDGDSVACKCARILVTIHECDDEDRTGIHRFTLHRGLAEEFVFHKDDSNSLQREK